MKKESKTTSPKRKATKAAWDFSAGEVGRYAGRVQGVNVVHIDDDVHEAFPDSRAVNRALRGLMQIMKEAPRRKAG